MSDIDDQSSGNYIYAESPGTERNGNDIGQMTRDNQEDFDVSWSVYNKVTKVEWTGTSPDVEELRFGYDAMQQRVSKQIDKSGTSNDEEYYYVTDASGNVMAIYHNQVEGGWKYMRREEVPLYGSDRVGMNKKSVDLWKTSVSTGMTINFLSTTTDVHRRTLGNKDYELKDHLGNVRVVISDRKESTITGGVPDDYRAEVESMVGYYPFGMEMPGMKYSSSTSYRFGFQGQEKDDELHGEGNSINYTYRMHDPRLGRFMSVDPLAAKYPYNSVYAFSENRVVDGVELEGLEFAGFGGFDPFASMRIGKWMNNPDNFHTVLDIFGMAPVIGEPADACNGLMYAFEGNYSDAGVSWAACIPIAGWGATICKWEQKLAKYAFEYTPEASKLVKQTGKVAEESAREIVTLTKTGSKYDALQVTQSIVFKKGETLKPKMGNATPRFPEADKLMVGFQSLDGYRGWRIDYDDTKGAHLNWWDYSGANKSEYREGAVLFEGASKEAVEYSKQQMTKTFVR